MRRLLCVIAARPLQGLRLTCIFWSAADSLPAADWMARMRESALAPTLASLTFSGCPLAVPLTTSDTAGVGRGGGVLVREWRR